MKRTIWTLLSIFYMLGSIAQPQVVYESLKHDFGSLVWYTPGIATFTVKNAGTSDLQIRQVEVSCGCTVATWTKSPIAPGASGVINVTYNAELLGHFEKYVDVYTNAEEKPVTLTLLGDVVMQKKEYTSDYPFRVGDIYFSTDNLVFDDVNKGDQPQQVITVFNGGQKTYEPELMHLPSYLSAKAVPERLRPGKTGKLIVTLDSRRLMDMGLTRTSIYVSRFPGDRVSADNEIAVSVIQLPGFTPLTSDQASKAPIISLSADTLILPAPDAKKKAKGTILISNEGKSTLLITSLQVLNSAINVSLGKRSIRPGETVKLTVNVVGKYLKSKGPRRVLLISNAPSSPKRFIDIVLN